MQHGPRGAVALLRRIRGGGGTSLADDAFADVVRSPIVLPVLAESLRPLDHRLLEDVCDAVVSLQGGELNIVRRSARTGGAGGRLVREIQPFRLEGGGGLLELGEEGAVEKGEDWERRSQGDGGDDDDTRGMADRRRNELTVGADPRTLGRVKKPALRHEEEGDSRSNARSSLQREMQGGRGNKPLIFMQEDDPEFEDLDEEDPDDDLDL